MTDALDLSLAQASTFEAVVGSDFVSADPDARFTLLEVTRHGIQPHAPRSEPFTLTFVGDPGLEQRTYALSHADLGILELFLVPIGPGPDGRFRYEAPFN